MSVDEDRKLFVAGLSETATEDTLREMFEAAGLSVQDVSMPRDRATGKARGFCFVGMKSADDAARAREALDGTLVEGRSVSVRPFRSDRTSPPSARGPRPASDPRSGPARPAGPRPGGPAGDDATVYVGNLPFDATPEDVTQMFQEAGFDDVKRVHLPTDPEGRRRGFGFVALADEAAAKRAAETVDGQSFRGRNLAVNLARRGGGSGGAGGAPGSANQGPARASRAPRSFGRGSDEFEPEAPPALPAFDDAPMKGDEARRTNKKEKKKDKKRKGKGLVPDRAAPKRRRNEEFHSSRAKDYIDDWEDD